MTIFRLMRVALRAIGRNRFRTFLTMLGIMIGVASVIAMLAIGQGSKKSIQTQIAGMGANMLFVRPGNDARGPASMGAGSMQTLTLADVQALRTRATLLSAVSPEVTGRGQAIAGPKNWSTQMHGVSPEYLSIRKLSVKSGAMFSDRDLQAAAKVCLLGKTVVDNLFGEGADPVGQMVRFQKVPFMVVGVLASKGETTFGQDQDDIIIAPYTTVQKRLLAITHIEAIYASAASEDVADSAASQVEAVLREQHRLGEKAEYDFSVRSQQELGTMLSSTSRILTVLLASIAGISLLVGGIGIMNIMYVSVTERTREIGLRMAVGARGMDIMHQFLIEAVLISVTGGVLGMVLGLGAAMAVAAVFRWPTAVTPFSLVLSFMVCVLTGVFFGWYPATKASQLDPIEALRYE